jgi:hypothetical protein
MSVSRYVAAPLLGFIALVQAVRFAQSWPVSVNGFDVPVWASAIAALVFGALAAMVWRENGSPRK